MRHLAVGPAYRRTSRQRKESCPRGHKSDLTTISMAARNEGDKQVARVHIRRDWAAQAEIPLKSENLDGKQESPDMVLSTRSR